MPHLDTNVHAAITAILLLRTILQIHEPKRPIQQRTNLIRSKPRLIVIGRGQGIVVEGHAVDDRDEQERPVAAAFGDGHVARVVYGEEDVCCAGEVGEGVFQGERVGRLHEHEGHGGAEEDDVGGGVFAKFFTFEVSFLSVEFV